MTLSPAKHLIIAGVTRAGTTSLFSYLSDHPGMCKSTIKETRFFLDHDELRRLHRYEDGAQGYNSFFPDCPADKVRLEATPDYLFRPVVAKRIADTLQDVHVVVVLREPIARMKSWRRYAIQNGLLASSVSLTEYVQTQFEAASKGESLPQHMRSIQEGRYSKYLRPWVDEFGRDRLTVVNYRELIDDPKGIVQRICGCVGIDRAFYDDYAFDIHNASRRVRWPGLHGVYRSLIWRLKPYVHDKPAMRSVLRRLRSVTDAVLGRSGNGGGRAVPGDALSDADRLKLEAYYQNEPEALAHLLGLDKWVW